MIDSTLFQGSFSNMLRILAFVAHLLQERARMQEHRERKEEEQKRH